jgi:hypothetical protein
MGLSPGDVERPRLEDYVRKYEHILVLERAGGIRGSEGSAGQRRSARPSCSRWPRITAPAVWFRVRVRLGREP